MKSSKIKNYSGPKVNQSVEFTVINEDGTIKTSRENKTYSWGSEPSFIKVYLQDIIYLSDMPSSHSSVLYEIVKRTSYANEYGMQVIINKYVKEQIRKELNFKNIGSIENIITSLVKGNVLIRIDQGAYNLNPYFFGKGDWQDISRLRLEINYDEIEGKTFKAICKYKDSESNKDNQDNQDSQDSQPKKALQNM